MNYAEINIQQKNYFNSGATYSYDFRIRQLKKLSELVSANEEKILEALFKDLHKSRFEAWGTEVGIIKTELNYFIRHLKEWMKPEKLRTPIFHYIAKTYIQKIPYGNTLIIAPWNYPFLLTLRPLIGAIAAGNTAIIKPSENAPYTAQLVEEIINNNFDSQYLYVANTDVTGTEKLLQQKFDFIFFTGGTAIGKIIYEAAAKNLTPVALELGGKNPCIIDETANLNVTAARIAWSAFSNCGQTCVSPDYLLVHKNIKPLLIEKIISNIEIYFTKDPNKSNDYGRIINTKHVNRIAALLKGVKIMYGGKIIPEEKYIAPTIVEVSTLDAAIMQEEVFGPVLPIIAYETIEQALTIIQKNPDPLVVYLFSKNKPLIKKLIEEVSCGDMVINEVMLHFGHLYMPIGGKGNSGIGKYQGKYSFNEFSHKKSVMHKTFFPDLAIRYPPYSEKKLNLLKNLFRLFFTR